MTTYPTGGEYREALYNTKLCFKDVSLAGGEVALDPLGLPKPISGASASVFTISGTDGRRWAVKCFTRFIEDQELRYQRISEALQSVDKYWRVGFSYLPSGVLCRGSWYPALKMEWVEASGLIQFIENNLQDTSALARLAQAFAAMTGELEALGIAHGDLQHGNLLVTQSGELKLIDYDGMFVPSLARLGSCEKGHANYQSPARTMSTWGPHLDHFSAWIIYSSLLALSIDPSLWALLRDPGDEALLFHHDDFINFGASRAFFALNHSSQPELREVCTAMGSLWTSDLTAIPPLDPALLPEPRRRTTPNDFAPAADGVAAGPVPDWITQAQARGLPAAPANPAGSSWITGHLPPLPLIPFSPPRLTCRLLAALTALIVLAAVASAVTGLLPDDLAGAAAFVMAAVFFPASAVLFRKTPEWSDKHERTTLYLRYRSDFRHADRRLAKLQEAKSRLDGREKKAVGRITRNASNARASEQAEFGKLSSELAKSIQALKRQRQRLQASEQKDLGEALRILQQHHVRSCLSQARISAARISGIGPGVIGSLAACGIWSAADFSGVQYLAGPRGGQQVYIRRANGSLVHPSGVGEKKAHDLDAWRRALERQAMASQPGRLPVAQETAIKSRYVHQRQALADQQKAAEVRNAAQQAQVAQKWTPARAALASELAAVRQAAARDRAKIDGEIAEARKRSGSAAWQRDLAERQLAAYRRVSYPRYLARVIGA